MPPSRPPFVVGDPVRDRLNPTEVGAVLGLDYDDQFDEWFVSVRFGTRRASVEAARLESWGGVPDPWADLAAGVFGSARDLRTLLTHERLRAPPGPVGASFGAARARLFPYQFKPLVKFLENPTHALLVADEVGLGKTIEAGYIHREWKLRHTVESVLALVPARLRTKWRDELAKRFDERFEIVGARELLRALDAVRRGGDLPPFQWIASYESLRRRDVIEALEEASPPLDLLLLDEAHRVRNRGTLQYRLARALCDAAQAKVFLSATPLQTGIDNLHTLLDLLEPGRFGLAADFHEFVDANRRIVRAVSLVASGRFVDAAGELGQLGGHRLTADLARDTAVEELIAELREAEPSRASRVRMQSAVGDLSLTGHVLTRTRKAEVIESRPVRSAQTVVVELNAAEREVYDAVREFTRLIHGDGGWGANMAALTAYRYTASCVPAAVEYMRARLGAEGLLDLVGEVDDDFVDTDEGDPIRMVDGGELLGRALRFRVADFGDTKLEGLCRALREIWAADDIARRSRRKVVLFSFFKRTLAYLSSCLLARGVVHERVDGGVPLDEREERIARFLQHPGCPLLLSSEVGGEGLDLQAAAVVVNYDLPWNPMVVEQRIGRVDRIGQEAERIVIINLVCSGTVEDRVLNRLYQRIRLFESSIGEMEDILGLQEVRELVVAYLSGDLSDGELQRRIDETADAAVRKQRQAEHLAGEVDGLLAADQAILDQLKVMVEGRRLPDASAIATLLLGFLERSFPGTRLDGDVARGHAELDLPSEARAAFQAWSEANAHAGRNLVGQLRRGPIAVTADGDVAMRDPRVEYLQARHPLVQFAVHAISESAAKSGTAFAARITATDVAPGAWVVGVWSVTETAGSAGANLLAVAASLDGDAVLAGDAAEPILRGLLGDPGEMSPPPVTDRARLQLAGERARVGVSRHLRRLRDEGAGEARRRLARRRTSWAASLLQQVDRARAHLEAMQVGGKPFAVTMAAAKLKKWEAQLARVMEELATTPTYGLDSHDVAVVLVDVRSE